MENTLTNQWYDLLKIEFDKAYYKTLLLTLNDEYNQYTIYPEKNDIYNALKYTDYKDVRVVILGQDPYHGPGQAHGLSFSVKPDIKIPPSLRNIYKELQTDIGCSIPDHGYLKKWSDQGVLLLNTVLTVRAGEAHSHKKLGWTHLTDHIIKCLNDRNEPMVFVLWGRHAQMKEALITQSHHHIIKSVHPSPLSASRGFIGSKPFSNTNTFLKSIGQNPIDWQIDNL